MNDTTVQVKKLEDVLGIMNRVNEVFSFSVYIPSLKKDVPFRELNTSQQKRLVKAIIDSPIYNTQFILTLRQIIKENCADASVNTDELTILDKLLIAIKMRSVCINDTLEFSIKTQDDDGKEKEVKRGISLQKVLDDIKTKLVIPDPLSVIDDHKAYEVTCSVPTIKTEYDMESELRQNNEKIDVNNINELRETIGNVFINEICKFVNKVVINLNNEQTIINMNELTFEQRIKIVENLPKKITENIIKYVNNVKENLNKVTLFEFNIKGKKYEERLEVDGSFFQSL